MERKELEQKYRNSITKGEEEYRQIKKAYYSLGSLRICVVLAAVAGCYFLRSQGGISIAILLLSAIAVFSGIVVRQKKMERRRKYIETSLDYCKNEIKAFGQDFSSFDGATERISTRHDFSFDLDLFGNGSVFQSVNRTCTAFGKEKLCEWFENPLVSEEKIKKRQKAVKELSEKDAKVFHFLITGLCYKSNGSDKKDIESFLSLAPFTRHLKGWESASRILPFTWIVLFVLFGIGLINGTLLSFFIIAALVAGETFNKKISILDKILGEKLKILETYNELVKIIEQGDYDSEALKSIRSVFVREGEKASSLFGKLVRLFENLEIRDNLIGRFLFNTLFFWDIRIGIKIERWKKIHGKELLLWIEKTGEYDAYNSLGLFRYNHPAYVFPEITGKYFHIRGKNLGHPLIPEEKCIRNDISIEKAPYFIIVTGANMAGKSTYLRTVGVNYVMACIGMPVFASEFSLYPARLVTSIRTNDSLTGNESYFFAELKRLKMIIEKLEKGEKLFIILDEILKGTNSVDKQKGSFALMQQFLKLNSCGIIATHDLLLGEIEKEFPGNASNFCFEADIEGNELSFSYKIKTGIAKNMNACFLMRKMGITI